MSSAAPSGEDGFIQIIEVVTDRPDDVQALTDRWLEATEGRRSAQRGTLTIDRDRPRTYVQIVEFPSYKDAMANSELPETSAFAAELARLCESPPTFRNLNIVRVEVM
jgi:hypothetical protein